MSTYRQVKGYNIKKVSGDPSNVKEGQVWYNSSTQKLNLGHRLESWSSGGNLGTAGTGVGGAGTQTAGLAFGRRQPPASPNHVGLSEEYDGSSWTEGSNLNTGRSYLAGCGTQTANLAFGGEAPGGTTANTEEYNGTSWSEQNNLNTGRRLLGG